MTQSIEYIRLNNGDDIVASVEVKDDGLLLFKPMRVFIENIIEESRQIVFLDEYLPQKMIAVNAVQIDKTNVMFHLPIRAEFITEYESFSNICYDENQYKPKPKVKADPSPDGDDKVVSLLDTLEAMKNKRGKLLN